LFRFLTGAEIILAIAAALTAAGVGWLAYRRLQTSLGKVRRACRDMLAEFEETKQSIAALDEKWTGIDRKCDTIDKKVVSLDEKWTGIDRKCDTIDKKVVSLARRNKKTKSELSDVFARIAKVDKVINRASRDIRDHIVNTSTASLAALWDNISEPARVDAALPLVLIAQIQRSGGTLLSQLLDGHPEVLSFPNELKWGQAGKHTWPQIEGGPLRAARSLLSGNIEELQIRNLFGYSKGSPASQNLPHRWCYWTYVKTFLTLWELSPPNTDRQCLNIFMTSFFSAYASLRGRELPKKYVTAFSPRINFIESYPENYRFFENYPDGLMLSICRQPADWYASASLFKSRYSDVDQAMDQWRESAASAIRLKELYPNQVILIAFADLVARNTEVMRFLADRLGLTWDPILVSPTFNGWTIGSNSSFNSAMGIDLSALERREKLSAETRDYIETENLELYQQFVKEADTTIALSAGATIA
jgi:hypothetical protein